MDPLTPNTTALLAYFSSVSDPQQQQSISSTFMSAPPSALFNNPPVNGAVDNNTPSSSSAAASVSPDALQALPLESGSEGETGVARRKSSGTMHKRKAGHGHTVDEVSDEDEDSGSEMSGHEDKRQTKTTGRRGRKSTGDENGKGGKEMSKAARRKEQNRAAQKAFRERREAKVKDLEDKVAELEAKSFTTGVENENLRGILKRLQEENVALKQSAFTFSMPVNKSPSGTSTPTTGANVGAYRPQTSKPPSPPHSVDDGLRSINDPPLAHRNSTGNEASPESLVSVQSRSPTEEAAKAHPSFDQAFNNFAAGGPWVPQNFQSGGQNSQQSLSDLLASLSRSNSSGLSPNSSASNNKSEIEALWASFYPNGTNTAPAPAAAPAPQPTQKPVGPGPGQDTSRAFDYFNPDGPAFANLASKGLSGIDKMAFRDPASSSRQASGPAPPPVASPSTVDWNAFAGNSDMDFLNSILGTSGSGNDAPANGSFSADDEFQASLNALLQQSAGASPSDAFALPNPSFSPTNYLNMSPSPLASISNSQSPSSILNSASQTGTPESSGSSNPSSTDAYGNTNYGNPKVANGTEVVHVVDETGKVLKPSELWVKMGMQHQSNVDNLVIDDLCDQMRAKATCKDGQMQLNLRDAEMMFKFRGNTFTKKAGEDKPDNSNAGLRRTDIIQTAGM